MCALLGKAIPKMAHYMLSRTFSLYTLIHSLITLFIICGFWFSILWFGNPRIYFYVFIISAKMNVVNIGGD